MIRPDQTASVFLYAESVDMRKSINGLAHLVEQEMELSPFDCSLFVFCNRKRDKIKILCWERNGFILWYKRLEKHRFRWPGDEVPAVMDGQTLNRLLDGYDIRPQTPHATLRYSTMG
ncbi:IS66 family insertion sequence element accessory protein TnpB [Motiliproteus sp. MSK22-1]|uniref:IS66 family insertion sequence element accessory protein TnpB n=2 Tax=Motiliproteus sp. MSK22-1 TaxID=1897630 RepID=UPI000975B870|nr:IS66 family insertion sequence element accessory protein TnpB [Motiliproteus sp. MSK22-1]